MPFHEPRHRLPAALNDPRVPVSLPDRPRANHARVAPRQQRDIRGGATQPADPSWPDDAVRVGFLSERMVALSTVQFA